MNLKAIQSQPGGGEGAPLTAGSLEALCKAVVEGRRPGASFPGSAGCEGQHGRRGGFSLLFMPHLSGQSKQPVN